MENMINYVYQLFCSLVIKFYLGLSGATYAPFGGEGPHLSADQVSQQEMADNCCQLSENHPSGYGG